MIADAHSDLLYELAFRRRESNPFATHWLAKLRAGNVGVQVCAVFVGHDNLPEGALREALLQIAACNRAVAGNSADAVLVSNREQLEGAVRDRRVGLVLSLEGVEPLGYEPELIDVFWALGVRIVGLTWTRRNPYADGNAEEGLGGLSRLGRNLIERIDALGMVIDLAHASDETYRDVLTATATDRVFVSHAGCRAVYDTPRNVTDQQLEQLAQRGGILGVLAYPPAVDPAEPTLDRMIDHIDHAVAVMGIDRVALGADFFQQVYLSGAFRDLPISDAPAGMTMGDPLHGLHGPDQYPRLVRALRLRGYKGDRLEAILSRNLLEFLKRTLSG